MAEPKKAQNSRGIRSILIEPFRQISFGLYMIVLCLVFMFGAAWLFFDAFSQQYSHVMEVFHVVDPQSQRELVIDDIFITNAIRLFFWFGFFLLTFFVIVFKLTHRYYGPLVSIERFIEQVSQGDYTSRLTIREKDELQNLAKKLNSLAEELEKRHGTNKK